MDKLEWYLQKWFGYTSFKDGQRDIMEAVLAGKDVVTVLPTGTGKSLCYQLPALVQPGLTVVVSPLLSLMENQVHELKQAGQKRVAAYNSFLTFQEKHYILNHLQSLKILYISPESLQQSMVMKQLKRHHISLLAVDEAHCISQWGHEFRTDYMKIGSVRKEMGQPPCLALTATATADVQRDIIRRLQLSDPAIFYHSVDRANISLEVIQAGLETEKRACLLQEVSRLPIPGIVYTASRRKTETTARLIESETDLAAAAYHGGMSQEDRNLIQQQFLAGDIDVICCTNAFGMGINKPNVRFVIHVDYPKDLESYVQEIGRAGRDGLESCAILLLGDKDGVIPRSIIEQEFPDSRQVREGISFISTEDSALAAEKKLIEIGGYEEQHARFLVHYWQEWHQESGNRDVLEAAAYINEIVERRTMWKLNKLRKMEEWLWNESMCRREKLLHYFEESTGERPQRCCDVCGLPETLPSPATPDRKRIPFNWEEQLRLLFHQEG
ncbi:RecQ family ATP-dependent DNA helicase [Bacillus piscicola]|uniref:RecQ family ATP-dependent DNA helicase n=1 Tax=Bacillus piscicola TaxID=1632684 RepID=UPI001F097D4C|nr:ATP-dependent DNA helicase RecQ [Bacillus piscicola]